MKKLSLFVFLSATLVATLTNALPFSFTTGAPDGRSATGSRPDSPGKIEIKSADDFILSSPTQLTSATFTGLLPSGVSLGSIGEVQLEIYRVFPNDSDIGRTPGAPTFSTVNVPTRVNSPSDVAFKIRNSLSGGGLSFAASLLNPTFTAANSILNGINPQPNQTTAVKGRSPVRKCNLA